MLSGPPVSGDVAAEILLERFLAGSVRQRRSLLSQLEQRSSELIPLIPNALDRLDPTGDDWAGGTLVQLLQSHGDEAARQEMSRRFPDGWLASPTSAGLEYRGLQWHLVNQEFEQADRLTSQRLRELAGPGAERRGYVYYSEVPAMATADLETLDRLWLVYSRGRFGFSVQGRLLAACGGRWEKLWGRLGWKQDGIWTRYPAAFTWSLDAPEGHMPLVNQLRGVRLMDALLQHPALARRIAAAAG